MKKSMINGIYRGTVGGAEMRKLSPKEQKLHAIANDACSAVEEILTPEQLELYKKFMDAWETAYYEEQSNFFASGFKLGLLIGIECMDD